MVCAVLGNRRRVSTDARSVNSVGRVRGSHPRGRESQLHTGRLRTRIDWVLWMGNVELIRQVDAVGLVVILLPFASLILAHGRALMDTIACCFTLPSWSTVFDAKRSQVRPPSR